MASVLPTCLFTGVPLGADAKVEHTIPRSIGGRIRSRIVSSTEFNERAGNTVDVELARTYRQIFNRLGPLLRSEHRAGAFSVSTPGSYAKLKAISGGRIVQKEVTVLALNAVTRKPHSIVGDRQAVELFLRRNGWDVSRANREFQMVTQERFMVAEEAPLVSPLAEVALIKSALLTFDHVLAGTPLRFTRDASLSAVRESVRQVIIDKTEEFHRVTKFVLGLQEQKLPLLNKLRDQVPIVRSPFEHFLLASGNPGTRTIDVAWNIAGIETWGFRFSETWRGAPFTCALLMGILPDTKTEGPFWLVGENPLFQRTELRSLQDFGTHQSIELIAARMGSYRSKAYQFASIHVELSCDAFVCENLAFAAIDCAENPNAAPLADGLLARLRRLFLVDPLTDRSMLFDQVVLANFDFKQPWAEQKIDANSLPPLESDLTAWLPLADWPNWLRTYRLLFTRLQDEIGLPDRIQSRSMKVTRVSVTTE
jgi:hypothetical protein